MAAKIAIMSSSLTIKLPLLTKFPSSSPTSSTHSFRRTNNFSINANLGGSNSTDGEQKKGDNKRKFITKEQEPEQYWQTAGEREGENPMSTPLPYFFIFGMSTPFVILAIAFANGWIKAPIR